MTDPGFFNEPSIAVNPRNPQQVVVAYQKNASVAYSEDGGTTWKIAKGATPQNYVVSGDVSITFDNSGHAVFCDNAFDDLGTYMYWGRGAKRNAILVRHSDDAGKTWTSNPTAVVSHDSASEFFDDKPFIAVANSGPHAGDLYLGWVRFTLEDTEIMFSRSHDEGRTWSSPLKLNAIPGLPRDDNGAVNGFNAIVAPDGTLYAIWSERNGIMLAISTDGGGTFSPERRILTTGPAYFDIAGLSSVTGYPQIDINAIDGGLYVTWSDYRNGDVDIFLSRSSDNAANWSAPVRVNDDPVHDGADQFFQWLAVDPVSGAVNVIFYDRRVNNRSTTVTLARSTDGGKTFKNFLWDGNSFEPDGDFLGDYLALAAYGNRVFGAWAHLTAGPAQVRRGRKGRTIVRIGTADFR